MGLGDKGYWLTERWNSKNNACGFWVGRMGRKGLMGREIEVMEAAGGGGKIGPIGQIGLIWRIWRIWRIGGGEKHEGTSAQRGRSQMFVQREHRTGSTTEHAEHTEGIRLNTMTYGPCCMRIRAAGMDSSQ